MKKIELTEWLFDVLESYISYGYGETAEDACYALEPLSDYLSEKLTERFSVEEKH